MKNLTPRQAKQKQTIHSAFADQLHKQQFRNHLFRSAGVLGGVMVLTGVLDYFLVEAQIIDTVISIFIDLYVNYQL